MWPRSRSSNKGCCGICKLAIIGAVSLGPEGTKRKATRTCRERERVLYGKGALSEAEICREITGRKTSLSHLASLNLPLGSWWYPPFAKPIGSQWVRKPTGAVHIGHPSWAQSRAEKVESRSGGSDGRCQAHWFQRVPKVILPCPSSFVLLSFV